MSRKALLSFVISFLLLITVIIIDRISFDKMRTYSQQVDHTRQVMTSLEQLSNYFKSAEIYSEKFAPIAEHTYYRLLKEEASEVKSELSLIQKLVSEDADQRTRIDMISTLIGEQIDTVMKYNIVEIIQKGEAVRLTQLFKIHNLINESLAHEESALKGRTKELLQFTRLNSWLTVFFSLIAIGIILITFLSHLSTSKKRKWLEGFLESVLNTSQNGIVSYKAIRENGVIRDFSVEYANKTIKPLLGVNPDDVVGRQLSSFHSFVNQAGLFDRYVKVAETGMQDEFEVVYDRGLIRRWLFVSLAKRQDGLTATFHDISRVKQYEEELKNNITKLESSNKDLEQYAYVASHDLQEPLRKIRIFASQLKESSGGQLNEKAMFFLEKIMSSAARMSNLIKDILSFSSLRKESSFEIVNLNEVVRNCMQDLEMAISQKNASIEIDDLCEIEAIPLQMNQLFYNLLNNALKFSKPGEQPKIRIGFRLPAKHEVLQHKTLQSELDYCEITFSDNGIGFDNAFASQIFGLFKRLGHKDSYGGSGIGLALCRKVVDNHKGLIFAHAKQNEGATFHIILPLRQEKGQKGMDTGQNNVSGS